MVALAIQLRSDVLAWLKKQHPEFTPKKGSCVFLQIYYFMPHEQNINCSYR